MNLQKYKLKKDFNKKKLEFFEFQQGWVSFYWALESTEKTSIAVVFLSLAFIVLFSIAIFYGKSLLFYAFDIYCGLFYAVFVLFAERLLLSFYY